MPALARERETARAHREGLPGPGSGRVHSQPKPPRRRRLFLLFLFVTLGCSCAALTYSHVRGNFFLSSAFRHDRVLGHNPGNRDGSGSDPGFAVLWPQLKPSKPGNSSSDPLQRGTSDPHLRLSKLFEREGVTHQRLSNVPKQLTLHHVSIVEDGSYPRIPLTNAVSSSPQEPQAASSAKSDAETPASHYIPPAHLSTSLTPPAPSTEASEASAQSKGSALLPPARAARARGSKKSAPGALGLSDDDKELFQRALLSSLSPDETAVPKVAFLFMTPGPLPLARLWSFFFAGHEGLFSIYVHASNKAPENLPPVFKGSLVPSKPVRWGEISVVDAERRLLAHALLDAQNARFILLSESCIPIFNFSFVYDTLLATNLSFVRVIEDAHRSNKDRWSKRFLPLVTRDSWRKGSQWFALTREVARVVVNDTTFYPLFRAYCVPHCYSDEHYLQTLLSLLVPLRLSNRSLTWTDWSASGSHPSSFGRQRVSKELIQRARGPRICRWGGADPSHCFLFARKFSPDALGPLMFLFLDFVF